MAVEDEARITISITVLRPFALGFEELAPNMKRSKPDRAERSTEC